MAYIKNPFDKKEQQSSESGVINTSSGNTGTQSGAPVSNWVNLNQIINGNQGTGQQMADTATSDVKTEAQGVVDDSGAWQNKAVKQAASGVKEDYSKKLEQTDFSRMSEADKNSYRNWQSRAAYSGPAAYDKAEGYDSLYEKKGKANERVAQAGDFTGGGQQGLAKETLGKGNANYGSGMSMLDTILMRQAGGGQSLDEVQNKYGKVGDDKTVLDQKLGTAQTEVAKAIKMNQIIAGRRDGAAQNVLNSKLAGLSDRATAAMKRANEEAQASNQRFYEEQKQKMLDAGVDPATIMNNLNKYITKASTNRSRGDVMTDAERTAANNLRQLDAVGNEAILKDMNTFYDPDKLVRDPRVDDAAIADLINKYGYHESPKGGADGNGNGGSGLPGSEIPGKVDDAAQDPLGTSVDTTNNAVEDVVDTHEDLDPTGTVKKANDTAKKWKKKFGR